MTRDEHLQWAKARANYFLDQGDVTSAWSSFISDMKKHPDLARHEFLEVGNKLFSTRVASAREMRKFINDFK
jgi:hypothetical protein